MYFNWKRDLREACMASATFTAFENGVLLPLLDQTLDNAYVRVVTHTFLLSQLQNLGALIQVEFLLSTGCSAIPSLTLVAV
jgi:hypothetical protein